MYVVQIMSGKPKEIARVERHLELELWHGATVRSKEYADCIIAQALMLEPFIEIECREVAA